MVTPRQKSIPAFLVERDYQAMMLGEPQWPTRPLWVVSTKDPLLMGLVDCTIGAEKPYMVRLWPAIVDVSVDERKALGDQILRALPGEYHLSFNETTSIRFGLPAPDPPEFIHMIHSGSQTEFILEPHAPRLWQITERDYGPQKAEWLPGFGEPPTAQETIRLERFLQTTA